MRLSVKNAGIYQFRKQKRQLEYKQSTKLFTLHTELIYTGKLRIWYGCRSRSEMILGTQGGGVCGVMVIVVGNGHGNSSSNPGRE